jgi:hypothetical protein
MMLVTWAPAERAVAIEETPIYVAGAGIVFNMVGLQSQQTKLI